MFRAMPEPFPTEFPSTAVVIPAAGSGTRMKAARNKVLLPLEGEPLFLRALRLFAGHPAVDRIVLVVGTEEMAAVEKMLKKYGESLGHRNKVQPLVTGGAERQDSVANGLEFLAGEPPEWVLVHDGARPFCTSALVGRVLGGLHIHPAVVPALSIDDTVRRAGSEEAGVVDRKGLVRCQTPQGFHWGVLRGAHSLALAEGRRGTDEAELVEAAGQPIFFVAGEPGNVKITTPQDLALAERMAGRGGA